MAVDNLKAQVLKKIDEMKDEIVDTVSKAVRIQSVNPPYPSVESKTVLGGEKRCNEVLKPIMEGFGCKTDMFEEAPQRTNLVGTLEE